MLEVRYVRCDVFSDHPFGGNPLAVFTDGRALDTETMQQIANEMNLSETVFILPAEQGNTARLRIFTPRLEIPFAGHPTLGAAVVLARPLQADHLVLETRIGAIPIRIDRTAADPRVAHMVLPPCTVEEVPKPAIVLEALGIEAANTPLFRYSYGISHIVVMLDSPRLLAQLTPNFAEMAYLGPVGVVACAIVPSEEAPLSAHTAVQVHARVFAPGFGVPEDPATGSAVTPIAMHLHRHGHLAGRTEVHITQGLELGRPSRLYARLLLDNLDIRHVEVGGEVVVLGRGSWHLPSHPASPSDGSTR